MSLSLLTLALFLIFEAVTRLGFIAVNDKLIGIFELIAGILLFVDTIRPITLFKRG